MTEIHRTAFGNCFSGIKNVFFLYGGSEKIRCFWKLSIQENMWA
jgi:hypothetical protein